MESKFSKKIYSDPDSYYMSCPEDVARHIASQLSNFKTCAEFCCAVGMMSIQLAKVMDKVYAIDKDRKSIGYAKKNAVLYGVADKIEFIEGDVLDPNLCKNISAEVAIADPDWRQRDGGKSDPVDSIDDTRPSLRKMFALIRKHVTRNIVTRVPITFTFETLKNFGPCRIESIIWDHRVRFKVIYFLENIKNNEEKDISFD